MTGGGDPSHQGRTPLRDPAEHETGAADVVVIQ